MYVCGERGFGGRYGPCEKVAVDHKLYISSASCFCSACRGCDYDSKCFAFSKYSAFVPKLELSVVEEKIIMDTGVDPAGVDAGVGGRRKKKKEIKFGGWNRGPVGC